MASAPRCFAIVACILLSYPAAARGEENEALQKARKLYTGLQFDEAAVVLAEALRFPNSRVQLIEIYELQGLTHAALGRQPEAREAFARLLMIDPDHQLPDYVAPRMVLPLQQARAEYGSGGWLRASQKGPTVVYPGDPITIEARLENDPFGMVDRFRIEYRVGDSERVSSEEVRAGPSARIGLDADLEARSETGVIEYWIALLDHYGSELYFIASPANPLRINWKPRPELALTPLGERVATQAAHPNAPIYETWWFWTTAGVVLAGAAAGILWAVSPEDQGCGGNLICPEDPLSR